MNWANRLFLLVNGVWFFRVGLHFWLLINQGPAGFDPATFQGPFLTLLSISQYSLPLLVFEMYLRAGKRANRLFVVSVANIFFVFTVGPGRKLRYIMNCMILNLSLFTGTTD